jgi:hypothetical protein
MLGTCPNRVIDPVNAARSMTAASTLQRLARSAVLNASCAARPSRIGTPPGCLDIGSSLVQLRNPNDCLPSALGTPASSQRLADEPACPAILDSPVAFLESPQDYPENIPCMAMSGASSDRAELYLGQPVEWWCGHRHRRHADQSDYIYIGRAGSFEYDDGCELSDTTSLTCAFTSYDIVFENLIPATASATAELQVHSGGSFQATNMWARPLSQIALRFHPTLGARLRSWAPYPA